MGFDPADARQLFDYDDWANGKLENALRTLPALPEEARKLWAHLFGTQELWLTRIEGGEYKQVAVWPAHGFDEACRARTRIRQRWSEYLARLDVGELRRRVAFVNSLGEPQNDPIEAILRHLVNHGTHHRAQLSALVRAGGAKPPGTDFIFWRRERERSA